jgi:uncharacterized membrane protein (GlpM family)
VAALIQDFQKQKINNHMSAGQAFQGGGLLPLGEAAILIAHLNLSASDQIMTKLTLQLVTQQKISIPLNFHALQSLVYLIEKLQIQAGWALHLGEMRIFQNAELTQDDQEPNKNNLH